MRRSRTSIGRRDFLVAACGAATAATLTTKTPAATAEAASKPRADPGGYRLSEHVRRYYRTALL